MPFLTPLSWAFASSPLAARTCEVRIPGGRFVNLRGLTMTAKRPEEVLRVDDEKGIKSESKQGREGRGQIGVGD